MKYSSEDCTKIIAGVKIVFNPSCKNNGCYSRGYIGTTIEDKKLFERNKTLPFRMQNEFAGQKPVQCPKCLAWFRNNILELEKNRREKFKDVKVNWEENTKTENSNE